MFFGLFSATVKSSVVGFEHFLGNKTLSIQRIGGTGHGLERFMCAFLFFLLAIHSSHGDNVPMGSQEFPGVPRNWFYRRYGILPREDLKGKKMKNRKKNCKTSKNAFFL